VQIVSKSRNAVLQSKVVLVCSKSTARQIFGNQRQNIGFESENRQNGEISGKEMAKDPKELYLKKLV
jgi:hypothetical protein